MLIPIHVNLLDSSSPGYRKLPPQLVQFGTDELFLVELQGALEVEGNQDGQLIGKLRVDETSKKPTLMIGHHLLEGKLVNLPKPLAVLRRHDPSAQSGLAQESAMDVDADEPGKSASPKSASWDIVAVVRRKMVFSNRPMPIVGSAKPLSSKPLSTVPLSRVGSKV